jgi:hypothetical protein
MSSLSRFIGAGACAAALLGLAGLPVLMQDPVQPDLLASTESQLGDIGPCPQSEHLLILAAVDAGQADTAEALKIGWAALRCPDRDPLKRVS